LHAQISHRRRARPVAHAPLHWPIC
jgi:hypothetical protein